MSFDSMNAEFTDNAFLFLVNRERIIRDERLYYVKVELPYELTYIGGFSPITLGEYVSWWHECPWAVRFDDDDSMSLVWFVADIPGKYENRCLAVDQTGQIVMFHAGSLSPMRSGLWEVTERRGKFMPENVYSLAEAVNILKEEMPSPEVYDRCLGQFYLQVKKAQAEDEDRCKKAERQVAEYKRRWYKAVFRLKKDEALQLYNEYISDYRRIEAFKEKSSPTLADVRERHGLELNMILNITRSIPKLFPEFVEKRFSTDIDVDGIVAALNDFMENEHLC